MEQWELEGLGEKLQDMVEQAVHSKDFEKLNQSMNQALNYVINREWESGKEKKAPQRTAAASVQEKKLQVSSLYAKLTGERMKNLLLVIVGGVFTGTMGITLPVFLGIYTLAGGETSFVTMAAGIMGLVLAAGIFMLSVGIRGWIRLLRFKKYTKALGNHTYAEFEKLAEKLGKPVKYVKRDVKGMIRMGWFLEGHVDAQETCVITSNETYRQYQETQSRLEQRKQEEAARLKEEHTRSPQVKEMLEKGNRYLEQLKKSNDAIPGQEISDKISHMEQIVAHIFKTAEEHPEVIPDLKKMMDYYLPMTVKLLDAYEEMDSQPVQGEIIRNSKKEIEDTLDTLNQAFERLLDSIFEDAAWDVSSDISVLHTMLAQEGLTGNEFQKKQ